MGGAVRSESEDDSRSAPIPEARGVEKEYAGATGPDKQAQIARSRSIMKLMRPTIVFLSAWVGATLSVFGAAGEFSPSVVVTPLQGNVSYSTTSPVLNTYAGFTVTGFANVGNNTVNDVIVMFEAKVTDSAESLALHLPEVYLSGLPAGCTWPTAAANTVTITCRVRQMRAGDTFPGFAVFYKMPVKVVNGVADGVNDDWISTTYTLGYAEGPNDCTNGCATLSSRCSRTRWSSAR